MSSDKWQVQHWYNHKYKIKTIPSYPRVLSCPFADSPPFASAPGNSSLATSYHYKLVCVLYQFSSVSQLYLIPWNPMDCSTPGLPVHHQLPELAQTHVHRVGDAIQPSHPLSSPSPPTFNLSQHQGLFQWVSSSHQVARVLEFQLQHQSFQWIFRTDFL